MTKTNTKTNPRANKSKAAKITKKGLVKLFVSLIFFATMLSFITAFVGEYITPMYGTSISWGIGTIVFGISWLCFIPSTNKDKPINIQNISMLILMIAAPCLLPSILTFVMTAISFITAILYYALSWKLK